MKNLTKLIVMGGSWGGIQAALAVLEGLPAGYPVPVLLVLHRLRNHESNLEKVFANKLALRVKEVEEKEIAMPGTVYLAPANYHVLIEKDLSFSLDSSAPENYSRPSIDVSFSSASDVLGGAVTGILLSGASKDGSLGLKQIADNGGIALVQEPTEAEIATMPESAISIIKNCRVLTAGKIQQYLLALP